MAHDPIQALRAAKRFCEKYQLAEFELHYRRSDELPWFAIFFEEEVTLDSFSPAGIGDSPHAAITNAIRNGLATKAAEEGAA